MPARREEAQDFQGHIHTGHRGQRPPSRHGVDFQDVAFARWSRKEIHAGDSPNGPFPDVVGRSQTVPGTGRITYAITGSPHRYYLIWITKLGPSYQKATINAVSAN